MPKFYIAGKITGKKGYKEDFKRAERYLEKFGPVLNPADLPAGLTPENYMSICFPMLFAADVVAFLPGYEESKGAMLEYNMAKYIGKGVIFLTTEELASTG